MRYCRTRDENDIGCWNPCEHEVCCEHANRQPLCNYCQKRKDLGYGK